MSNTPNAPVIVVTEEKKRRKGMIWIAGGAAVAVAALGGGTFALWSDSAAFDGGTITAGDLDLRKVEETKFYDISPDRDDVTAISANGVELKDTTEHLNVSDDASPKDGTVFTGHLINDISTWRIVPGDTVAAVVPATVHLVGDNLVAELSVDPTKFVPGTDADGDTTLADGADEIAGAEQQDIDGFTDDLTYTYTVYGTDGAALAGYDHVAIDDDFTGHLAYFDAATDGQLAGVADVEDGVIAVDATTGLLNVTVVIEASFQDTDDRVDVGAAEIIGDLELSLTQLRAGTEGIDGTTGVGANNTN